MQSTLPGNQPNEPSPIAVVVRAVEAGQRMVLDRVELMQLEVKQSLKSAGQAAGFAAAGGSALLLGWVAVAAGLVVLLNLVLPLWAAFGLVGVVHMAAGGALLMVAMKKPHAPQLDPKSPPQGATDLTHQPDAVPVR